MRTASDYRLLMEQDPRIISSFLSTFDDGNVHHRHDELGQWAIKLELIHPLSPDTRRTKTNPIWHAWRSTLCRLFEALDQTLKDRCNGRSLDESRQTIPTSDWRVIHRPKQRYFKLVRPGTVITGSAKLNVVERAAQLTKHLTEVFNELYELEEWDVMPERDQIMAEELKQRVLEFEAEMKMKAGFINDRLGQLRKRLGVDVDPDLAG